MLTEIQKATLKTLAENDPHLVQFLKLTSRFINAPKIYSHLLANGIKGRQLKEMILRDFSGDPERFVKGMIQRINGKLI